ncbi:MAG: phage tail sheath C-terminal domain-containing protein [Almyronema sp.]
MPITPTYPGVYIEEIPSGVRTIAGVSTSIAAFVGYFSQGLMNKAVQIFNMGDFEREFGGLNRRSEASYGIQQFFLNGGTEAWVVRTASGDVAAADVQIQASMGGATALTVQAGQRDPTTHPELINPGTWGNNLRVNIDYPTPLSGDRFNLSVALIETSNGQEVIVRSEVFNGLTMDATDLARFVGAVVNDEFSGSKLIRVTPTGSSRPAQTGTVSAPLNPFPAITNPNRQLSVTIGSHSGIARLAATPTSLAEARTLLAAAIQAARPDLKAFSQASVAIGDDRLRILAGPTAASDRLTFAAASDPTAAKLGLLAGEARAGVLSADLSGAGWPLSGQIEITVGGSGPITLSLATMGDIDQARTELETRIRAASSDPGAAGDAEAFANARVIAYRDAGAADERLIVLAGTAATAVSVAQSGTDTLVDDLGLGATATTVAAFVSEPISSTPLVSTGDTVAMAFAAGTPETATFATGANTLSAIAAALETAIRNANAATSFTAARVAIYPFGPGRLVLLSGNAGDSVTITAPVTDSSTVAELGLDTAAANVQSYALGAGAAIASTAQGIGTVGADGSPPNSTALIGDSTAKTGMNALRDVDLFNLLCIPRTAVIAGTDALSATDAFAVLAAARDFCEERRAFLLIDPPTGVDAVQEVKDWLDANNNLRSQNAAFYFPRVLMPDPLNDFKLRAVGPSGTLAGLYARTDSDRGVWKAPAGTEATLSNVFKLETPLTDAENGTLNPLAINCLRTFPIYGTICWGARTLDGADAIGSEYKYVPVRRLALFIEETLFRGLKWVVFEPNDEPLWAQIRLNVGAFMNTLFRQGAFQGQTPRQAYLVKCDKETTTQNDIDRGMVNILVGFAPLKPAEFVFIKLQQLAGQIQT